ncbi:hypothetical protein ABGT15_01400 [Flavobacterium enshiense]|uniref:hypothetical protein n=1 Tax=Flavobacterium enshiense TaxID=1341165 RepID=UPI00345D3F6E
MKLKQLALPLLVLLSFYTAKAQTSIETLSEAFDQTIEKENLNINNGVYHTNIFRISNNKHQYYPSEKFSKGTINYEGQDYFNRSVKYDIYLDNLILQPIESEVVSFNLTPQKTGCFKINGRKFIYLNNLDFPMSTIKTGYYEENICNSNFTFYIRHHRDKREVIKDVKILIEFDDNYEYFLKKEGAFHKISSRKDVIKIFPQHKRKINDFYLASRQLEKENLPLFYEKLFSYLNTVIDHNLQ